MPSVWDRTHASRPTQRVASVRLFFPSSLSPFVLPFSLFCPIYRSLSLLSLPFTAVQLSIRCQSVNFFVLSTISPFTTPFPLFVAFRSRISASLLNNCPLRRNYRIERSKVAGGSSFYIGIYLLFNINTCLQFYLPWFTVLLFVSIKLRSSNMITGIYQIK